jgi:hypothetical protein
VAAHNLIKMLSHRWNYTAVWSEGAVLVTF